MSPPSFGGGVRVRLNGMEFTVHRRQGVSDMFSLRDRLLRRNNSMQSLTFFPTALQIGSPLGADLRRMEADAGSDFIAASAVG